MTLASPNRWHRLRCGAMVDNTWVRHLYSMLFLLFGSRQPELPGGQACVPSSLATRPLTVMESRFIDRHPRVMDYYWVQDTTQGSYARSLPMNNYLSRLSHVATGSRPGTVFSFFSSLILISAGSFASRACCIQVGEHSNT